MSEQAAHANHDQHYIRIWQVLLVLLVISVLGPMLEIQTVTLVTAFGIAVVKAYLVAKDDAESNRMLLAKIAREAEIGARNTLRK